MHPPKYQRRLVARPSRLAALFGFKFLRIFTIPAASMLRRPTVELAISDGVDMFEVSSSVKTEQNCSLSILALS